MNDTPVHIATLGGAIAPDRLRALVAGLEHDGFSARLSEGEGGLSQALAASETQLLVVSVCGGEVGRLLGLLRDSGRRRPTIVLLAEHTASSLSADAVLAPEVDDILLEPINLRDVRLRVRRLAHDAGLGSPHAAAVPEGVLAALAARNFVGSAPAFLRAVEKLPRVACCDVTVLILGETGTGKERCARAIHYLSRRASGPFIPINCGSVPPELFDNELFGHEAGAYTDARHAQAGLVAEASGGTLFLDEVDTLSAASQVKLLRFLQERQYKPLGASRYRESDARVVAATNVDLQRRVMAGCFREDLYYRLKVVTLELPPLRERREDIAALAELFLETAANEYGLPVRRLSAEALRALVAHRWPGNIRELENAVRRAVVFADGPAIRSEHLQLGLPAPAGALESLKDAKARAVGEFERDYLERALADCGGNISEAARRSRKDRRAFFELLKKHGLTRAHAGPT